MTRFMWPVATVLRGQVVMREGELSGPLRGRPVGFLDVPVSPSAPA